MRAPLRPLLLRLGKWLFVGGLLWFAIGMVEPGALTATLARFSPTLLLLFVFLHFVIRWLSAWRWELALKRLAPEIPFSAGSLFSIVVFAEFVGVALPSTLSAEAVRVAKLREAGVGIGRGGLSIFADRFAGLLGLMAMAPAMLLAPELEGAVSFAAGETRALAAVASVSGAAFAGWLWWGQRGRGRFGETLRRLAFGATVWGALIGMTVAAHLLAAWGLYLLFASVHPFTFAAVVTLMVAGALARIAPVSVAGISGTEVTTVAVAVALGAPEESALAVALVGLATRYVYAAIGLALEMRSDGLRVVRRWRGYVE